MNKDKFIFLDFDGVLTMRKTNWNLSQDKLDVLKYILDNTGAKLVISSSWRKKDLDSTVAYLASKGFPFTDYIVGVTPHSSNYITDYKMVSVCRGNDILSWMNLNIDTDAYSYVIIDDDSDMLYCQKDNFVRTNPKLGLTMANAKRCIRILNK